MAVERATAELVGVNGRTPNVDLVAAHAGLTTEEVLEALAVRETQRSVSLDVPLYSAEPEGETLGDSVGRNESGFDRVEAQLAVDSCAGLNPKERHALHLRFIDGLNQYEIAKELGISQMQVSRVLRRGLAKMLEAVQGDESPDGRRSLEETTPDARFPNGRTRARTARQATAA